jgi:DNA processing protein
VVGTLCARAVAMVGSRAPTRAALDAAERIAHDLARAGVVVVSGLARGIDAAAHRGALAGGGLGIAVFGTGPDVVYPREHRALATRIEAQGALLSELLPGAPPLRHHFPLRNRIVTGVAEALVVVEARERSGTLVSAAHAIAQGREVFVVPGPIGRPACAGSNRLLREGAQVLLESDDVLLHLGIAPPRVARAATREARTPVRDRARPSDLDPLAMRILVRLERTAATRDELARALGVEVAQLALPLFDLGLAGRVAADRDGRFVLRVSGGS